MELPLRTARALACRTLASARSQRSRSRGRALAGSAVAPRARPALSGPGRAAGRGARMACEPPSLSALLAPAGSAAGAPVAAAARRRAPPGCRRSAGTAPVADRPTPPLAAGHDRGAPGDKDRGGPRNRRPRGFHRSVYSCYEPHCPSHRVLPGAAQSLMGRHPPRDLLVTAPPPRTAPPHPSGRTRPRRGAQLG